ncbi:serine/threonine-protein kinase [Paraliomyxa miuraensis]|uniref:serine/threonine-protein kinase n=1 Tax=Paraliomyxa miuraensis TaxID=376150 RepID=UPI0022517F21|nr:serine/threonine-protein kinase [Paraliomyxa miuraensis]MCX4240556.1 tetratricopeptide repeat-containing serine/threonine protein kinase [Paraliomyxa miuraensis]
MAQRQMDHESTRDAPTASASIRDGSALDGLALDPTSPIGAGTMVGRYVVLQKLGAGGMGVVHAAYDPELDRKVALKLVVPEKAGRTSRVRLMREAQALGRLSHPHVVAVYDVGAFDDQLWIAMELVQGTTLAKWLKTTRPWHEVLAVMRKAGEGLAAAHAAGLLHRDFKPDNVMIGDDGRVRVMDFGLAREHTAEDSSGSQSGLAGHGALAATVTRAGAVVGTPGYMSPEQFANQPLTAAVDQFAFCVTAWEALYGQRPFRGRSVEELATNVLHGNLRPPPRGSAVPGWLRRACERGLAIDPAQRWPSMTALLDVLARGHARVRTRRAVAAVGVLVLLGVGLEGQRRWDLARRTTACDATAAELDPVWNPEREQAMRAALTSATADRVTPWIERRVSEWREARVETCLDAEVRQQWAAGTVDRSLWCLDARRTGLQSLVEELSSADARLVHKAVVAAATLPSTTACRDPAALASMTSPPDGDRESVRLIRADVIRAANLERAGEYERGLALARDALTRAQALGWAPLVAEARTRVGWLLQRSGTFAEAEAELERAYFESARGVAPEAGFEAAVGLARTVGFDQDRYAEGRRWARLADVAREDVFDGEGLRKALLASVLANVELDAGDLDQAMAGQREALELYERAVGNEHPSVATVLSNLANVHHAKGEFEQANQLYARAVAISKQTLGNDHPDVANGLNNLAAIATRMGAHADALAHGEEALAIRERALGNEHPDVADTLSNLAVAHMSMGAMPRALEHGERALAIHEKVLGPEHPRMAAILANLGLMHEAMGHMDEARVLYERALAISRAALGPHHPNVALCLNNLANLHHEVGNLAEAERIYADAIVAWEQGLGPEHPNLVPSLGGKAKVLLEQGRAAEAVPLAERAVALGEQVGTLPAELADAHFTLAEALWDASADAGAGRVRSMELARRAQDELRGAGDVDAEFSKELETWLATRRDGP